MILKYKVHVLFILVTLTNYFVNAQTRDQSEVLYNRGNVAFAKKDYKTADSLFTLSLKLLPHPDTYYNRAVCKRNLNDFTGYCLDLKGASDFGDPEAKRIYWNQCAKADTIYKKKDGEITTKNNHEIIEFVTSYKYNSNFEYEKRDTAKQIILSKFRTDNITIYRSCLEVEDAMYKKEIDSLTKYIKTRTELFKIIEENKLIGFVNLLVLIDENGKVKITKITNGIKDSAVTKLIDILLESPNWSPAIYNNKAVKFQADISVTYYDKEFSIFVNSHSNKSAHKTFNVVEEMPEFPGGVVEMMKYIQKTILYPQMAKEAGLEGKCFLKFVIMPNGKIVNIEVLKGVPGCRECDKEAIKTLQKMPLWKPGKQNGKTVPVFFNLPINFELR